MIEVFRRKKRFFLVFEYLEHTVLEELEARSGGLGFITSRKYIYQVLRALDFIHSHDVSIDLGPCHEIRHCVTHNIFVHFTGYPS